MLSAHRGPPICRICGKEASDGFKILMNSNRFKKYLEDGLMFPDWMISSEYTKLIANQENQMKTLLTEVGLLKKK
jgi:tripartite-type tricarboxylate transporter receptor subunit TctC